ncbi:MAG: sugar transferase [Lysobacterales bacterium]
MRSSDEAHTLPSQGPCHSVAKCFAQHRRKNPRSAVGLVPRLQHDLWYIQNWSLWLDLKILLMTPLVLVHRNAY